MRAALRPDAERAPYPTTWVDVSVSLAPTREWTRCSTAFRLATVSDVATAQRQPGSAFPAAEYRDRLERARQALARSDLDGALCVSPESLFYLAGYEGYTYWAEQALVFSLQGDEPTLVVRDIDLPLVEESTWVEDIRTDHLGTEDPVEIVRQVLAEKGLLGTTLGVELQSRTFSAGYFARFQAQLGELVRFDDASRILAKLRVQKSRAELQYIEAAAEMARRGMDAALAAVRPGVTEIELTARLEGGLRDAGS